MTTLSDSFNRADGSVGAAWNQYSGTWNVASNECSIASGSGTVLLHVTPLSTAHQFVEVKYVTAPSSSMGIVLRAAAGAGTYYVCRNDGSNTQVFTNISGSFSAVGPSHSGGIPAGATVRYQINNDVHKVFVNGVEIISFTNTAISGSNVLVGLRGNSGQRYDDFSAGDVTSAVTHNGVVAMSSGSVLTVGGTREMLGAAALSGVSALSVAADVEQLATAAFSSSSLLTVSGLAERVVTVAMVSSSELAVAGETSVPAQAALVSVSALAVSALLEHAVAVGLVSASELAVGAPMLEHAAAVALVSTSQLFAHYSVPGGHPEYGSHVEVLRTALMTSFIEVLDTQRRYVTDVVAQ